MDAKLFEYRSKKRREAMVEAAKNSIKEVLSWQRSRTTAIEVRLFPICFYYLVFKKGNICKRFLVISIFSLSYAYVC
jgi:hypothetical protein